MAIELRWCRVLQTHVTCVTDLEGVIARVICYEYDEAEGTCRLKQKAAEGGPLAQLLARQAENALADAGRSCSIL